MSFLCSAQARRSRFRPRLEALESRDCPSGGLLDTTFNGTGTQTVAGFDGNGARADVVQPADGKVVAVGATPNPGQAGMYMKAISVVRLNRNGSLDTTFNGSGSVTINVDYVAVGRAVALQPNGQILVGRHAESVNDPTGFSDTA
jgi:hypothetical protein